MKYKLQKLLTLSLLLITTLILINLTITPASAAEIKCYNHGRLIYSGHGHRIEYTDDYLVFTEDPSKKLVFVFANCVIRVKSKVLHHCSHGRNKHAAHQRF